MKLRNPLRRADHYPAVKEIADFWLHRATKHEGDRAEYEACMAAWRSVGNWIIYATKGKERRNPEIVDVARLSAQKAYDFSKICSEAEEARAA